jgi:monoamine oxidase
LQRLVPDALKFTAADWEHFFKTSTYGGRPYWKWGFWNLISRVVSNEGYQLMQAALGIESAIANWNSAMSLPMMALLTQDFIAGKFSRPANGWSELPQKLASAVSAAVPHSVNLNHELRQVRLTNDPVHPFELEFAVPEGYTARAARLVLCLPRRAIDQLRLDRRLQFGKEDLPGRLARVGEISAFRFYVSYKQPWWQTFSGWQHGYAVTDLPVKQVFYGAGLGSKAAVADQQRVLMASYADYHSVDFWRGLIGMEDEPEMHMLPPEKTEDDPMPQSVEAQLREMHSYTLPFPKADSVGYANWSPHGAGAAWHAWRPGGDLSQWIPEIRQPFQDLPLFICGEAFSNFQGWVEGALGSAENMLEKCFHLNRPAWLPQSLDLGP